MLAYLASKGVSNGGTEAINLLIEKTRRLAHGLRNFDNCGLRIMLVADGSRPYRQRPNHLEPKSRESGVRAVPVGIDHVT